MREISDPNELPQMESSGENAARSNDHSVPSVSSTENSVRSCGRRLSLIIPAWNEEEAIVQAVREATTALASYTKTYEIIVVDDGSTDATPELVRAESTINPAVRLVQQPANLGYGAALRAGFEAAHYELVAFTDADCQFDLADLEYMLPLADRYDIVSGYRMNRQDSVLRRFYSWGYNTLIQFLLGSPIRDIDCALKVFHRQQLQTILPETDNFFANTDMLTRAQADGLSVVDVGVHHRPRAAGHSKVSIKEVPKTLHTLLPFWWTRTLFASRDGAATESMGRCWPALVFFVLIAGVMLFRNLSFPLTEPDEGRYAEIPREMLSSGDWIVPRLHHEPYLDKPPLFYWLCASSYTVFGPSEWAARLVPATAAFLTMLCTFLFGRRILGNRSALFGLIVSTLCIGFIYSGRFLVMDSLLTFFVALSLFTAFEAIHDDRLHWFWWTVSAIACGFGMLTKGPVALVLLVPPVLAHIWLSQSRVRPNVTAWAVYGLVAFGIAVPWYAAIIARDPSFAYHFFLEQNVTRFLAGVNHPQPVWFYLPVVVLGWMPWGLLLFSVGIFLFHRSRSFRSIRPVSLGYFVLWAGWCLLFFSLSRGKLPTYILPAFPAIALLLGFFIDRIVLFPTAVVSKHPIPGLWFRAGACVLCSAAIIVNTGTYFLRLETLSGSILRAGFWSIPLIGIVCFRKRLTPKVAVGVFTAVAFAALFQSSQDLLPAWGRKWSVFPVAAPALKKQLKDETIPVALCGKDWGSVPFYLERDDLRRFEPQRVHDLADFVHRSERAFLILDRSVDWNEVRKEFPKESAVSTLSTTPRATILLVQAPDDRTRPDGPSPARIAHGPKKTEGWGQSNLRR